VKAPLNPGKQRKEKKSQCGHIARKLPAGWSPTIDHCPRLQWPEGDLKNKMDKGY
jgi:hypothetical protein